MLDSLFSCYSSLLSELRSAAISFGIERFAIVGGAVRDCLLYERSHISRFTVSDLDFVLEGDPYVLALSLLDRFGSDRVTHLKEYRSFGTVSLQLDGISLDFATAREESYYKPGHNPSVVTGTLETDLRRRDFTINAMAYDLISGHFYDPYHGLIDLDSHTLSFLHHESVSDDPTRVIRASRYAARLGFTLAPESLKQVTSTVLSWPWSYSLGDPSDPVPPALSSRLFMELDRLFAFEPWSKALHFLEDWQAMYLLDPALQHDPSRSLRLLQANRLGLPLLPAFLSVVSNPELVARRLSLSGQQQLWLQQLLRFRYWLLSPDVPHVHASPDVWTASLESQGWMPETVALMVCSQPHQWKPLLRWWGRWRHLKSPRSARDLIADGWSPGPELGAQLIHLRLEALKQSR